MDKFDIFAQLVSKKVSRSNIVNWSDLQKMVEETNKIYKTQLEKHERGLDQALAECRDNYGDGD